ncbi:hypothetical protein A6E05_04180 [Aliivibrio sp. 1S165]|uniref:hypothetical protein n=1 Tax=unclassified Aliivibrio TaxID=2645654 RepID=UPI00080E3CAE|nr:MULTISPECIES: hypothetical protein [unclassified Aliivibrio]OCH14382.1 hypothetical protein A6E05_04180 [Aliivibrio sp. 1S165]OCH34208.1 hypothetical protein A6E06_16560 [Aliivibrio sp. 1S175]
MRKICWLGLLPCFVMAQEEDKNYGYSYFTFGFENVMYEEYYGTLQSKVTITNPVLNSGGLYYINEDFDFSIDALASFSPQSAQEDWNNNSQLMQTNQFEYLKTATNIQLHYKMTDEWRVIGGPALTYQTYTRYGMKNHNGFTNKVFYGSWEETSTDIFVDLGLAYDNGSLFGDDKWKISGRAVFGIPIYSVTKNTQFEDNTFNDFGVRTSIEGTVSYEVMRGLHLGWYAMLGYEKRFETDKQKVQFETCVTMIDGECTEREMKSGYATLPEADTYTFSTGLQAIWSF